MLAIIERSRENAFRAVNRELISINEKLSALLREISWTNNLSETSRNVWRRKRLSINNTTITPITPQ